MGFGFRLLSVALLASLIGSSVAAVSFPFTEDFSAGSAGWEDSAGAALLGESSGGPDGGSYVATFFNYFGFTSPFGGGPVIFRANDSDAASGDAFVGDWIASGVQTLTLFVRHDAPEELTWFMRVANSFNFPGAVIAGTQSVPPGVWTQLSFTIDPLSPLCIGETVSCTQALQNVGNLQFGTDAPLALTTTNTAFRLEIDKVSLVPEPATLALLIAGLASLAAPGHARARRARR